MIILFQKSWRLRSVASKFAYWLQGGSRDDLWNSNFGNNSSCNSLYFRGLYFKSISQDFIRTFCKNKSLYDIFFLETFQAFWLQHGVYGYIGGATPGKYIMGLRVVQCQSITPVQRPNEPNLVLVSPGTDLGLPLALGRSVAKNFVLAFLFPVCFSLFFFRFNRTGYDLICNSIVIEDPYRNTNNNRIHQQ